MNMDSNEGAGSVRTLLEQAGELERGGHVKEAIELYEKSLQVEERREILQHLGNLYNQSGQLDEEASRSR